MTGDTNLVLIHVVAGVVLVAQGVAAVSGRGNLGDFIRPAGVVMLVYGLMSLAAAAMVS